MAAFWNIRGIYDNKYKIYDIISENADYKKSIGLILKRWKASYAERILKL